MVKKLTEDFFSQALERLREPDGTWEAPFKTNKHEPPDDAKAVSIHDAIELRKDVGQLLKRLGANVMISDSDPCYCPEDHKIYVPHPSMYDTMDYFYHSLFHELGHWSGKELMRISLMTGAVSKSMHQAEEMVAELVAVFLCEAFGFKPYHSGTYLTSFARDLPKDLIKATMRHAKDATHYLLRHQ